MRATLILIVLATVLNVGLWVWSPRAIGSRQLTSATPTATRGVSTGESALARQAQCPVPAAALPASGDAKANPAGAEKVPDQPWLNTVRDNVMALSLSPKVADRLGIKDVQCAGAKCEIAGALKPASEGSSDVAALMKTMNDGDIAGGDSARIVMLNAIQPGSAGTEFTMTVEGHEGPPINPCKSVMDAWKEMHPDDFAEKNPFKAKG
jgi:hypothetical protein